MSSPASVVRKTGDELHEKLESTEMRDVHEQLTTMAESMAAQNNEGDAISNPDPPSPIVASEVSSS